MLFSKDQEAFRMDTSSSETSSQVKGGTFDFDAHRRLSVERYVLLRPKYDAMAAAVKTILDAIARSSSLPVHSVQARAKSIESFGEKAARPSDEDPERPKYREPVNEIKDLAGVRVITFFRSTIDDVGAAIREAFDVEEVVDHAQRALEEDRLGYLSVHYVVTMKSERIALPEYSPFLGVSAEIQVRTILQHTWAEIEHDIQYKSVDAIPRTLRRRFLSLAGLLEIADREFEAIQEEDRQLQTRTVESVQKGDLGALEITGKSLKAFLDKAIGSDKRLNQWSYDWTASLVRQLGFQTLAEVSACIEGLDDDSISRIVHGTRVGQLTRFEDMLLAGMGEEFVASHRWASRPWFVGRMKEALRALRAAGIAVGSYVPPGKIATSE